METKMFSIRDAKAEVFNKPFHATTHGEAERNFQTAVNDPKTTLSQYPEDFDLYYIGTYNDNTGRFLSLDTPEHLMKAVNCLKKEHQPAQI